MRNKAPFTNVGVSSVVPQTKHKQVVFREEVCSEEITVSDVVVGMTKQRIP
jgi:hypothetical protein